MGGTFPADMTVETWMATSQGTPMPTGITLLPLEQVLTSQYFPNDPNITSKSAAVAANVQ